MALPPKKKQTAGTVDNWNTSTKSGSGTPVKSSTVSTNQVHGAIKAFVAKKAKMSAKTKKRVAARLKGMAGGK